MLLQEGGMKTLATLLAKTASERVRLKVLVLTRRLLYEVGSTSVMDPEALKVRVSASVQLAFEVPVKSY